jgi:hypothetical protein
MEDAVKEYIEKFLDEFIKIEYRGKDHVLARTHYRDVFNELIPKYFVIKQNGTEGSSEGRNSKQKTNEGDNK